MQTDNHERDLLSVQPADGLSHCEFATTSMPALKRHAACDECRKRKLKCSGEASGCSRCLKQSLTCHYSVQKQMGRPPKKRAREGDSDLDLFGLADDNEVWPESSDYNPDPTPIPDSFYLCPPFYTAPLGCPQAFPHLLSTDENHNHSWQLNRQKFLNPVPATTSPWPDFSSVSAAASTPFALPPGLSLTQSPPLTPQSPDSSNTDCTCLSYLYLCLSHLSSLAPFPISQHTICSLFIGAKTARAVLRCQSCPTKFATAMQNVMFTGTLLNVLGDAWLRVFKGDAVELGRQAAPPAYVAEVTQNSLNPTEAWKDWLRKTVRGGIIGTPADAAGAVLCSDSPSLLSLIEEMEARQRRWHETPPSEHCGKDPIKFGTSERDEQDMLCLRVAKSAREIIAKFEFEPHEYSVVS
ncbi:hypothetical protein FE257_010181 [Aspergillus nanangensis]|uniref:Zn(2)-C6 fungal-type domain-containing protein n=1 Tax=Aspergillus nanangensis TaxID=2582783 RepID=A0AAD4CJ17_ASPNN|nr:hypothetical protein FE257_010181 [Aspergillus nanangensis]